MEIGRYRQGEKEEKIEINEMELGLMMTALLHKSK